MVQWLGGLKIKIYLAYYELYSNLQYLIEISWSLSITRLVEYTIHYQLFESLLIISIHILPL